MNGAELPCGTALKVEPSDPLYAIRKKRQQAIQYGQVPADVMESEEVEGKQQSAKSNGVSHRVQSKELASQPQVEESEAVANNNDDGDDLDDFFASL